MALENIKLIQLIRSMSPQEWRRFGVFVDERTEKGSREHRLYRSLNSHFSVLGRKQLDSTTLLKQVFGSGETDGRKLRRSMNRMMGMAEEFLGRNAFSEQPIASSLFVLEEYSDRGLKTLHRGLAGKIRSKLDEAPKDVDWYGLDYQLEFDIAKFEERTEGRKAESRTQQISNKLDVHYAVNRLKLACAIFARQRLYDQQYDQGLLEPLLEQLEKRPPTTMLVKLYHHSVLMMVHADEDGHYQTLRELLKESDGQVAVSELTDLHVIAQNHCIRGINAGKSGYVKELFELYKLGLDQEVIQTDPTHFAPAFKNIISVAIRLKEFKWAKWFIDNHAQLLGKNTKDYLRYNLAMLHYAQAEYQKCRAYIHGEKFTDIFIKMNVRILLLKTYFELNQLDLVENSLDNFKQFLHRNKQLGYHRKNCFGFIKMTRALINMAPGDEKARERLVKKISSEKHLAERKWLTSKLNVS